MKLKDIANHFNVSIVTISKVINGKEGVSDRLRNNIKDYLIKNNISLNENNSIVNVNKNNLIGIIIPNNFYDKTDSFYTYFIKCLLLALDKHGYFGIVYVINERDIEKETIPRIITDKIVDGIIMLGQISSEYLLKIKKTKIPVVLCDFYNSELGIVSITANNYNNSYLLTNYLFNKGHKNIGFIGNIYSTTSIRDRYLGFEKSQIEHNIVTNPNWIIKDTYNSDTNIQEFNLPKELPTAFVSNCDQTAYIFIEYLKKKGIDVPQTCSIAAFDNSAYTELSNPRITTMSVDINYMSDKTVEILIDRINNKNYSHPNVLIDGIIIENNSVIAI